MFSKKLLTAFAMMSLSLFALTGCGEETATGDVKVLKVGATPVPHAEMLEQIKDDLKTNDNVDLQIVEFNDYVQPNIALNDKELDANFFQHQPYLDDFISEHKEMKIYFPEYKEALGKVDGAFSLELLKQAPFPDDLIALGEDGIKQIWHAAKLRGRGYSRAKEILQYAKVSAGIKDGASAAKTAVKWFVQKILELDDELNVIENQLNQKCQEIPHAGNILEISGIGENTLSGILAEMGDISRFDDVKEIQKLSGLGLVACSSGKHKGETKISHRGRKRLRYWLFQAAKSVVAHAEEFKELHIYYTTRADNPLKKMQSLIAIACKLLRIIYTILKKGTVYDPKKMLMDIKRPEKKGTVAA